MGSGRDDGYGAVTLQSDKKAHFAQNCTGHVSVSGEED